ncbi:MAG TPA: hypothetical protein PKB14_11385 [Rubrivivax sp.]|nr:hypothetical protein [Rubrivivax sp.]
MPKSAAPRSTSLHHPNQPFRGAARAAHLAQDLRELAHRYLKSVQADAGISDELLALLDKNDNQAPNFGWLPLLWGSGEAAQANAGRLGSFRVARELRGGPVDHSVILLAGYRLKGNQSCGGEVGLRVVAHLAPQGDGPDWAVRITGVSSSRLPQSFAGAPAIDADETRLRQRIADLAASLAYDAAAIDGLAYIDPATGHGLRVFLSCAKASPPSHALRNFRCVAELPGDGGAARLYTPVERISRAQARAFVLDPASCPPPQQIEKRRATRKPHELNPLRVPTQRIPPLLRRQADVLQPPEFEVRQTGLGQVYGNPDAVQQIDPARLALRSDDLAAAHAYLRGDELMRRLEAYGLMPAQYFKRARLPLLLRHRAALKGARDGISVNAQVRPLGAGPGLWGIWQSDSGQPPPELELSFGWAELAHRKRLKNRAKRRRAQPLGLAADERWAWHEFGHVLNYASFGELEFRFAHSAGDALAAIVADPDACREGGVPADRFRTFPWVFIARRHDRDAARGWCWCGRRNLARLSLPGADTSRLPHLGYFEEQLLSSSLFRLYRCIGGDDTDLDTRRSASDYCVYLVMRAIQLLGSDPVVPAYKVEAFVEALIDADIGTGAWDIDATWPEATWPRKVNRVGGCVHKVIRWAFERQGLYAKVADDQTFEGPGEAPPVDIFIADLRPGAPGGYEPVPLSATAGQTPGWHAGDAGIKLGPGEVVVSVGNRGELDAQGVAVQCWMLSTASSSAQDPSAWLPLGAGTPAQTVKPGLAVSFEFALPAGGAALPPGDYWVKAAASCVDDPSNIDPAAGLAPAGRKVALDELVASDNNLGLRKLTI